MTTYRMETETTIITSFHKYLTFSNPEIIVAIVIRTTIIITTTTITTIAATIEINNVNRTTIAPTTGDNKINETNKTSYPTMVLLQHKFKDFTLITILDPNNNVPSAFYKFPQMMKPCFYIASITITLIAFRHGWKSHLSVLFVERMSGRTFDKYMMRNLKNNKLI